MTIGTGVLVFGAFGLGVFAGIEFAKWYAVNKAESSVDPEITKVFGSGYAGQIATGVFNSAVGAVVGN